MDEENDLMQGGDDDLSAVSDYLPDDGDTEDGEDYADANDAEGQDYAQSRNTVQTEAPQAIAPFVRSDNPFLNQIAERYGDPELAQLIQGAISHTQNQGFAAQAYAGSYAQQSAQSAPELYAPERNLSQYRARTPVELQGTPFGEVMVALGPELERLSQTNNLPEFWQSLRKRIGGNAPSAQAARPVAVTPPRTPSPSAGGGSATPTARQMQKSGSRASNYLQNLGYSANEAKELSRKVEI